MVTCNSCPLCFLFSSVFFLFKIRSYRCFLLGHLNGHLFGNELFICFTVRVLRGRLSVCECVVVFCFEGWTWDLIVLVPDHCLSFYFDLVL